MKIFTTTRVVQEDDLDALQHVNNVRYVQWIQDVSEAHWNVISKPEWTSAYFWVVRKHVIEYSGSAGSGDEVTISTFIKENKGAISTRVVEMFQARNGKLILKAETDWCLLQAGNLKPVRIPKEMLAYLNSL